MAYNYEALPKRGNLPFSGLRYTKGQEFHKLRYTKGDWELCYVGKLFIIASFESG